MNNLFKKSLIILVTAQSCFVYVHAAKIIINAPESALGNRQPIVVQVFLDPEQDSLSGIAGDFSFPSDMFTLKSIGMESSVVSLWATQPKQSAEKYLDNRSHVTFEGIFPGGFNGVRSPYYQGTQPGFLFSVTLIPKGEGKGTLIVDELVLNSFTSDARPLPARSEVKNISVPTLTGAPAYIDTSLERVNSRTLTAVVEQSELINNYAYYLAINEREPISAIDKVYVAETDVYNPETLPENAWRIASVPYILLYQDRTKYIHVKVIYSNNTYAIKTIAPVENSQSISTLSRILVSIVALLSILYFYGTKLFTSFRKKT